jgi:hypothetical protein
MKSLFSNLRSTPQALASSVVLASMLALSSLGCTPSQQANSKAIVEKMIAYEPEITSAVDIVSSVVATLAPADAALINAGQSTFNAAAAELLAAENAYVATPNAGTLASVNTVLQTLLTANANQFLAAAHISDPGSVAIAKAAISGVRVLLLLIDGLLTPVLPASTVTADNAAQPIHLRDIEPYVDAASKQRVEVATGHSYRVVYDYATAQGF